MRFWAGPKVVKRGLKISKYDLTYERFFWYKDSFYGEASFLKQLCITETMT